MLSPNHDNTLHARLSSCVAKDSTHMTVLIYSISKYKVKREQPQQTVSKKNLLWNHLIQINIMIFWHIFYNRGILPTRITLLDFSRMIFS